MEPWWRGQSPPSDPASRGGPVRVLTGTVRAQDLAADDTIARTSTAGLSPLYFFRAHTIGVDVRLDDTHLAVEWSEFDSCHFRQRVKPVLNAAGFAAQGSFGSRPAVYRGCTFERVRFKTLGGFTSGKALFEGCTFLNCRWEGHFAYDTDLVGCRFIGRMNGCVWGGRSEPTATQPVRRNLISGNDFSEAQLTENIGWRADSPLDDQLWPAGYVPLPDR